SASLDMTKHRSTIIKRLTARDARLSGFRFYDLLVHIFVVILLISNLVGQKICVIPFIPLSRVSGAQLLFPITYIFGDIFTEVYGYGASRRAIWIAFFANILLTLMGVFTTWFPAAPEFTNQKAFEAVSTPISYWIVNSLKRAEGIDVYDRGTNFNPFARMVG